jgi:hypothetical protein
MYGSIYVLIFNSIGIITFAKIPNLGIRSVQLTGNWQAPNKKLLFL